MKNKNGIGLTEIVFLAVAFLLIMGLSFAGVVLEEWLREWARS